MYRFDFDYYRSNRNRVKKNDKQTKAYLKGLAMTMEPIFQIGKSSLTPENTAAVAEALESQS